MSWIGKHTIIDGYFDENSPLCSTGGGTQFLTELVTEIDMTIIVPPYVIQYPVCPNVFDRIKISLEQESLYNTKLYQELEKLEKIRNGILKGISGLVVLAESHIAYHTFPEYKDEDKFFVSIDVYSCKDYDIEILNKFLLKNGIKKANEVIIERFTDRPQILKFNNFKE